MKPSSGFIVSIFLLLLTAPIYTHAQQKDCRKIDATVQVTDSSNGQRGSIKVTSGQDVKLTLHLIAIGDTTKDQLRITANTIVNIAPGTYDLVIQSNTQGYCSETRKVTVN